MHRDNFKKLPLHGHKASQAQNSFTLDTGWVACGEKINRSLYSHKIKLFLWGAILVICREFEGAC
jgi:hypothetical protein